MDMLHDVLNKMDDIKFIKASDNYFFNYDKLLDCLYKNFKAGNIQKNHYFVVHSNAPTSMISKTYINDENETTFNFHKDTPHRAVLLETYTLEHLNAPGIRDIKQVELWKNWRQYIPDPYKDIMCPEPTKEVVDKIQKDKSRKQKEKVASKKRPRVTKTTKKSKYYY